MGYTPLESEIAYSKASVNTKPAQITTQAQATSGAGSMGAEQTTLKADTAEPENTKTNQPAVSAADRVTQGVGTQPRYKFRSANSAQRREKEVTTVKDMLSEGYSITDIAQGFIDNGYTARQVIGTFKDAGVSADDTFNALSTIVVDKSQEANKQQKPMAKFKTNSKLTARWEKQQQEQENKIKQTAIKGLVEQMSAAGYDIEPALGGIVQSLKDAGMSAAEVKDFLIGKVSDIKPTAKFRGHGIVRAILWIFNRNPTMESFGKGEVSLAAAMLNAGYSADEVKASFAHKNGTFKLFYGQYSYTSEAISGIMSGAQQIIKAENQEQTLNTSGAQNNNLNDDINKRQTQAVPL
jgi:hypothetical protein